MSVSRTLETVATAVMVTAARSDVPSLTRLTVRVVDPPGRTPSMANGSVPRRSGSCTSMDTVPPPTAPSIGVVLSVNVPKVRAR